VKGRPLGKFGSAHSRPPWASMIERRSRAPCPCRPISVVKNASNNLGVSDEIPTTAVLTDTSNLGCVVLVRSDTSSAAPIRYRLHRFDAVNQD